MKIIFIFLVITFASCHEETRKPVLVGKKTIAFIFEENGKQGLMDTLGRVLLKAKYDFIDDNSMFGLLQTDSGGHAFQDHDLVGYEFNKIGLIDLQGKIIAEPRYDDVHFNWSPLGLVKLNKKYGYIDVRGNVRIPIEFDLAFPPEFLGFLCNE